MPGRSAILLDLRARLQRGPWYRKAEQIGFFRLGIAAAGVIAHLVCAAAGSLPTSVPTPKWAVIVAGLFLVAAGLAATAAHYLASVDPVHFPEGPALRKGSRTVAWLLLMTALSVGIAWRGLPGQPKLGGTGNYSANHAFRSRCIECSNLFPTRHAEAARR